MSSRPRARLAVRLAAIGLAAAMWPLVAPASPALAAPATPNFAAAIDAYASNDPQDTCDPSAKPGTLALRTLLLQHYPSTHDSGISRDCNAGDTSEHKEGRAFDWGTTSGPAENFLDWLLATDRHGNQHAMARRLGVMYVIWNRRIWSAARHSEGWRTYTGDNPHTDHVHLSLSWDGANKRTSWWSGQQQFLVSAGGSLYHTLRATGGWTQFGSVEGAAGSIGTPQFIAATEVRGETHVLAVTGGTLYHTVRKTTGSWSPFGNVENAVPGGAGTINDVEAAEVGGELHVIASTTAGNLYHTIRNTNGTWEPWGNVENAASEIGRAKELAAAGFGGALHVLAVNDNGSLYHAVRNSNGTWSNFGNVETAAGSAGLVDDVAAANVRGDLHVVVNNTAGDVLHTARVPSGAWTGFGSVEAGAAGSIGTAVDVGAVGEANGDFHLIAANSLGQTFHTIRRPNGTWSVFGNVETAAGAVPNPTIEVTGA